MVEDSSCDIPTSDAVAPPCVQISALWNYFTFNVPEVTPQRSRGALVILCMAAKSRPQILSSHIQSVMDIGLGRRAKEDPLLARYACIALQRLSGDDRVNLGAGHKIFSILCSLITGPGGCHFLGTRSP